MKYNNLELSKNDIAEVLVMNIKYIQAIESGNYSSFPSEGFARAYFIKYQDFLSVKNVTIKRHEKVNGNVIY